MAHAARKAATCRVGGRQHVFGDAIVAGGGCVQLRLHLQTLMWSSAGIVRTTKGLQAGLQDVQQVRVAADALLLQPGLHSQAEQELRNLATVGELVLRCALLRKESRGLHFNTDFPLPIETERRPSVIRGALSELAATKRGLFETGGALLATAAAR